MAATPRFKPVRARRTVQDQVYDQLREALVSGAFEAGEGFTIPALSEKFMTSHMPIREALRRLAAENALRISSTGTAVVPALDVKELGHICQARLILEPAVAEMAFANLTAEDIAEMRANLEAHRATGETGDVVTMLAANRAFHFLIYRASGNPVLVSQIENLWLRSGAYVRFLSDRMRELLRTSYKVGYTLHHDEMLAAHEAGDSAAFRDAMHRDVQETHDLLFKFLKEDDRAG
ncbi:GntR family transcriptional regulator [Pseudooceanicola sp. HF7]|uniref:GntR family transcriptional regulator n=1 Tax=Pseudooceanicola sp. HF7 TaxID=2721560 RepID=UPI001431DD8E|nr:GntR family transcriptional regulator [Pseudooceanicola sp. HF7]NIZ10860.1 GntR family transcriptional regulator [Pseudooceanicola sp. HF7]